MTTHSTPVHRRTDLKSRACWVRSGWWAARLLISAVLVAQVAGRAELGAADASAAAAPAPPTVELTASQLAAIAVAPIAAVAFSDERSEIGSVALAQDPVLIQAESTLLSTQATRDLTSAECRRAQGLVATHGISQRELEQATSDQQSADAAYQAALVALRAAGEAEADIQRLLAVHHLDAAAPAGNARWISAAVVEEDVPLLAVGQAVTAQVQAVPGRRFLGTVVRIYDALDPVAHRLTIRCLVSDEHRELRPGMLATLTIQIGAATACPALPDHGLVREGDGSWTAWTTSDHRHFTQHVITPGLRAHGLVQIRDGLQVGDLAVTDGALLLDNLLNAPPQD